MEDSLSSSDSVNRKAKMDLTFDCKITDTSLKEGFLVVPSRFMYLLPTGHDTRMLQVKLLDSGEQVHLSYNPLHGRLRGSRVLIGWYATNNARIGDFVRVNRPTENHLELAVIKSEGYIPSEGFSSGKLATDTEWRLYGRVQNALLRCLKRARKNDILIEITANGGTPPDRLVLRLGRKETDALSKRQLAPDLFGVVSEWESVLGVGPLRDKRDRYITAEVKNKSVSIGDFYQAKRYGEVFDAKYAFLVSSRPLPARVGRFLGESPGLTRYRSSAGERLVIFAELMQRRDDFYFPRFTDASTF